MGETNDKIVYAAMCTRDPAKDNVGVGSFTEGAIYPVETTSKSPQVITACDQQSTSIIDKTKFDRYFKKVDVQLTPKMRAADHVKWEEVMDLAQKYGYVAQAAGGTAILISHEVQLEQYGFGEFIRIQKMNGIEQSSLPYPFNGVNAELKLQENAG